MERNPIITFKEYFPLLTELEKSHPDFGKVTIELFWHEGKLRKALVSDKTKNIFLNGDRNE
jgi:hypothetical protein